MTRNRLGLVIVAVLILATTLAPAPAMAGSATAQLADLKWTAAGFPGVATATVDGDMTKGASHFYLKYDPGFVTPVHHHSPDHYVVVISGTLLLTVDGKEHRLGPGSFFALTGKAKHAARVDGKEPAIMFIDARGAWDVVPESAAADKE
jgi:quercetin dioxygenase-like cupin family protein